MKVQCYFNSVFSSTNRFGITLKGKLPFICSEVAVIEEIWDVFLICSFRASHNVVAGLPHHQGFKRRDKHKETARKIEVTVFCNQPQVTWALCVLVIGSDSPGSTYSKGRGAQRV